MGNDVYRNVSDQLYSGQQGIDYLLVKSYKDYGQESKVLGIRSPQAFDDMVSRDMIASGKDDDTTTRDVFLTCLATLFT